MEIMEPQEESVALTWTIEEREGSMIVKFSGEIDENVDFSELCKGLHGKVVFDLAGIRRINSCGVREWVNFVRDLPGVSELVFIDCSPVTVTQLNMIYNFRGRARILSVYAPFICETCEVEDQKLLDMATLFPGGKITDLPEYLCPRCNQPMVFDDIPERYLSFVMDA